MQRHVLYLGEINDAERAAWCKMIVVLEGSDTKQIAIFPEHRPAPGLDCAVVQVRLEQLSLEQLSLERPRQWGACWLALEFWSWLQLDEFWAERLVPLPLYRISPGIRLPGSKVAGNRLRACAPLAQLGTVQTKAETVGADDA